MTLRGHEPAVPETHAEIADRLRNFEVALWELIIHLPDDPKLREELLKAGCDLASYFRTKIGPRADETPRS